MKIGINCGHTFKGAGSGTQGLFNESKWTRIVGYHLMSELILKQCEVIDCTVHEAKSQEEYLRKCIETANKAKCDILISIHFNKANSQAKGSEVWTYKGKVDAMTSKILAATSRLGFRKRGVKNGSNLYIVKNSNMPCYLLELCFCDNEDDTTILRSVGGARVGKVLADFICQ